MPDRSPAFADRRLYLESQRRLRGGFVHRLHEESPAITNSLLLVAGLQAGFSPYSFSGSSSARGA